MSNMRLIFQRIGRR